MDLLSLFKMLACFLGCLLIAYLGDLLFRIPNGFTFKFPSRNTGNNNRVCNQPWFNFQIPSFIGIIFSGMIARNYLAILIEHLNFDLVNIIRIISTVTIIYKIGLGLDIKVLRNHKLVIAVLSLLPNLIEALYVTFYSYKVKGLLNKDFALCLGFEVSGSSTAILMPVLLGFQQENFSHSTGIPSFMLAASVIDNIFSIFAFNFARTMAVSSAPFTLTLIERIEGLLLGLAIGLLMGLTLKSLVAKIKPEGVFKIGYFGGIGLVFVLDGYGFRGAGFILVFVSTLMTTNSDPKVEELSERFWGVLRLYLFFFIGISIDFKQIDQNLLENAILLVLSSSALRAFVTITILYFLENLSRKELVFAGVTWMAKASLQAALGTSILYESISRKYSSDVISQSLTISQISICYIVITGPLGAMFLNKYGRGLLENDCKGLNRKPEKQEENVKLILR